MSEMSTEDLNLVARFNDAMYVHLTQQTKDSNLCSRDEKLMSQLLSRYLPLPPVYQKKGMTEKAYPKSILPQSATLC